MNLDNFYNNYNLVTILGPTAGGKTSVAANIAFNFDGEIISGDSRQVYRGMDLGTGKDLADYTINNKQINYHLIDIVDAGSKYNLFEFQKDFFAAFGKIKNLNKLPVLCGGTGLYIESIVDNYNILEVPENKDLRNQLHEMSMIELIAILSDIKQLHNKSDFDTKKRLIRAIEIEYFYKENPVKSTIYPKIKSLNIGIKFDRETQRKRITERLKQRFSDGMIDEVKLLIENGISTETLIYYGLEYKFITYYLIGQLTYNQMFEGLNSAIHQFQKRQMTWFRKMEKEGIKIHWLDGYMEMQKKIEIIEKLMIY